jgi:serine/threonine-protein kinase RsbW
VLTKNQDINNDNNYQKFCLRVHTELEALVPVLKWFDTSTASLSNDTIIWQTKVALAEAFTNTVRYAHQNLPTTTFIDLEILIFPDYLEMKIWDRGQGFDLQQKLQEIKESKKNPLEKEGSRGLLFMQGFTDELEYIHLSAAKNCLIMRKKFIN